MTEVEGTHDNSDTEIEQPNQKRIKLNERREGSKVRSWIWKYFEPNFKEGVRYAVCKVEVVVGKECGKTYKIGTSTSNCSDHLANIHGITQEQEEANVNQNQNIKDVFSKVTYHQESRQLEFPKQSERLEKIQKQFIQPNSNSSSRTPIDARKTSKYLRHVIADVPTRWNSSYLAWC
ncbi:unnamed protein product [Rhizophagus irregularis]|nr:unnamed protein product [Rhizophagus irregularis]